MEPKDIHEFDQAMSNIKSYMAPAMKSFYDGLVLVGFLPNQALYLTGIWLRRMVPRPGSLPQKEE
jgi:hypothetical protein